MRIIGGAHRGRRLNVARVAGLRPTSDRVREGLASALAARQRFEGAHVLDLFAGSGALGLEALSRGAASVVAIDASKDAVRCVKENAAALQLDAQVRALRMQLLGSAQPTAQRIAAHADPPFDLIFADPPYAEIERALALLQALPRTAISQDALLVVEHASGGPPVALEGFENTASYRYGDTSIALFSPIPYK